MKNTARTNSPVTAVMNEYVAWGGPIVTRIEAHADAVLSGFTGRELDYIVFGRAAVPAPEDPAAHVAFLRRIQQVEGRIIEAVAA